MGQLFTCLINGVRGVRETINKNINFKGVSLLRRWMSETELVKSPKVLDLKSTSVPNIVLCATKTSNDRADSYNKAVGLKSNRKILSVFFQEGFIREKQMDTVVKKKYGGAKPRDILKIYYRLLTSYEQTEILSYKRVYYFGLNAKKRTGMDNSPFDDTNGCYKLIRHDHIHYRYEIREKLGEGSFGVVTRAYDYKRKEFVAIKVIKNHPDTKSRGKYEAEILEYLKKVDRKHKINLVRLLSTFQFRDHTCLVLELMSWSLKELIDSYGSFTVMLTQHVIKCILRSLHALNRHRIVHGDLKPGNLLKRRGTLDIVLCDFGLSRFAEPGVSYSDRNMQTRWYRAPEVITGYPYGLPIDMWSVGCVLIEMLKGWPPFRGWDDSDQLASIIEAIGNPPKDIIEGSVRKSHFFDKTGKAKYLALNKHDRSFSQNTTFRGRPGTRNIKSITASRDKHLVDFLKKCFSWDPAERLTPEAALQHPWVNNHNEELDDIERYFWQSLSNHDPAYSK